MLLINRGTPVDEAIAVRYEAMTVINHTHLICLRCELIVRSLSIIQVTMASGGTINEDPQSSGSLIEEG